MTFKKLQEQWEEENLFKFSKKSKDAKRWKKDREDNYRTEYQRDIGRILFSDAFRRLRMKTQVFRASGIDQHSRTRLTHSLEVAQIAKSIARPLRLNVDLTESISLGHDLGHAPFGHAGEKALNRCLQKMGSGTFNHNVQSVWIVRTILADRKNIHGKDYRGLNLTHDTVEGIWKHTNFKNTIKEIKSLEKYNPDELSSLEGQVVEWADRIAYIRHDIDDALRQNLIQYQEVEKILKECFSSSFKFNNHNWSHYFIYNLINNNVNNIESTKIGFSENFKDKFKKIKHFIDDKIISSNFIQDNDNEGEEKITTIFEYCINNPEYLLDKYGEGNTYKMEKYGKERMIVDFIQWCGDELANEIYKKIDQNCL